VRACFMLERWRERERYKEGKNEERLECGCALSLQGWAHPLHRSEREREREREYLFLKGMKGALVPFRYLVGYIGL
jgi:hypothetical protein